jgi:hypothetical protein
LRVALAVVVLLDGVDVDEDVGGLAELPHAARNSAMTMLSNANPDAVRFINTSAFLSITATFTMLHLTQSKNLLQELTLLQ